MNAVVIEEVAGRRQDAGARRDGAKLAPGTRATALDLRRLISDPVLDFYQVLRDVPVPVVTRVQGRANGVGCAIAALADVAVAADTARFQVPEMTHDIAPTLVMNALADRIPRAALARLVLTRDAVEAAEAKALGLTFDAYKAQLLSKVSLRRTVSAEDIAGMALFLCTPNGQNITGQALSVCGGVQTLA